MPDSYDKFIGVDNDMTDVEVCAFKRLFLSADGQFVLGKILEKCKFMEACENERDMALNNFAKDLMATIYWDRQKRSLNIYRVIEFLKNKLKKGSK